MHRIKTALTAALLTLAGCGNVAAGNTSVPVTDNRAGGGGTPPPRDGPPEVQYGPEETMSGTFVTRFEHVDFNGCWLDMDAATYADFRRRFPGRDAHSGRFGTFQLQIVGRRSIDDGSGPPSYGHVGGWRCQIEATRIISATEVGRDRSAPDEEVQTGFSAGHDQARLKDIQRNLPPETR